MRKRSIEQLCKDLKLPSGDEFTQDWIYELPEEFRTFEYFKKYFNTYIFSNYNAETKALLLDLMLDVTNDLVENELKVGERAWSALTFILNKERNTYQESIDYWLLEGEPIDNCFALTPFIRDFMRQFH